jgi:hypothetical protein
MFAILPLLHFAVTFLAFQVRSDRSGGRIPWRGPFLSASVVWGVTLTAITEILSILNFVTFAGIVVLWTAATTLPAFVYLHPRYGRRSALAHSWKIPTGVTPVQILLVCGVGLVAGLIGLIALVAPPNNFDSMAYHLPRVAHWIQNRSVEHYPTHILRQLYQGPWAEFAILHFQILSGGDRFANLVQWFSMVGSIAGVSLIAMHLGAGLRGQIFAAAILATLPMGILQASSTQNDYVVSYWLTCVIHYTLLLITRERPVWLHAAGTGASLGLATLTKGTAYILALPYVVWLGATMFRKSGLRLWGRVAVLAVLAVLMNIGHFRRNIDLFGAPLSTGRQAYFNETHSLPAFISNVLRNASLHMATPIEQVNRVVHRAFRSIHSRLDLDIDDPRTTFDGTRFTERVFTPSTHEDRAGNAIHLLLILAAIPMILSSKDVRRLPGVLSYLFVTAGAAMLLNLMIKWQPWGSRLHLPIFVLFAPICAIALDNLRWRRVADAAVVMLLVVSSPWVFFNKSRPLVGKRNVFAVGRVEQYFANVPALKDPFIKAARLVKSSKCKNIGLSLGESDWEYPIWVLVKPAGTEAFRIEHVDVRNECAAKATIAPFKEFRPCAIASVNSTAGRVELRMLEGAFKESRDGARSNAWTSP